MPAADFLASTDTVWLATTRADGSPHLTPIWFAWHDARVWICTSRRHVKAHALRRDPRVMLAFGAPGTAAAIAVGRAEAFARPYPAGVRAAFVARFDWDIDVDDDDGTFDVLFGITVERWVQGSAG